jgi:hypothetical protein
MEAADNHLHTGGNDVLNYDTPDAAYDEAQEFWRHYETVTGRRVEDQKRTIFSCSC